MQLRIDQDDSRSHVLAYEPIKREIFQREIMKKGQADGVSPSIEVFLPTVKCPTKIGHAKGVNRKGYPVLRQKGPAQLFMIIG